GRPPPRRCPEPCAPPSAGRAPWRRARRPPRSAGGRRRSPPAPPPPPGPRARSRPPRSSPGADAAERERDREAGALAGRALDLDPAAVVGDDAVGGREPEAVPLALGGEVRLEEPRQVRRGDAAAAVPHDEPRLAPAVVELAGHRDDTSHGSALLLDRV